MTPRFLFRAFAVSAVLTMPAAPALAAPCGTGSFRGLARRFQDRSRRQGHFPGRDHIRPERRDARIKAVLSRDHSQAGLQPELRGIFRPHGAAPPDARRQHAEAIWLGARRASSRPTACRAKCWWRSGDWKPISASTSENSRRSARWRRWPMIAGASDDVPGRIDGRAAHRRARRSRAAGNARRLGRRNRPDPVHAVVLSSNTRSISTATAAAICCTARPTCWHRPRTTSPATAGSAARTGSPAAPNFARDPAMEQERGLRQDHRLFRDPARARALKY